MYRRRIAGAVCGLLLIATVAGFALSSSSVTGSGVRIVRAPCTVSLNGAPYAPGTCSGTFYPAPTPTPTATPTPNPTTDCFAAPGKCGYPDPNYNNVGVPSGTTLTPSGSLSVSASGTTLQNLLVTGSIYVNAANVTIKDVEVVASGGNAAAAISIGPNGSGALIEDSTLHGTAASGSGNIESGVWNHYNLSVTAARVDIFNSSDPWEGTGTINDSHLFVNGLFTGAHAEDVYFSDGVISLNHDTLLNNQEQTATVFGDTHVGSGGACDNHLTLTNSLLAGGGFMLYPCGNASSIGSSTMNVGNNRLARCLTTPVFISSTGGWACSGGADAFGYWPHGGYFGLDAYTYCPPLSGQTWSNNVWDDNNALISC